MPSQPETEVDPTLFRETLGHCPTSVAVVTAMVDGSPVGMIVGTFTSVSLDPPLVAFMPQRDSYTFARLRTSPVFTVNVLAHDQETVCRALMRRGEDKFAGVSWGPSSNGSPLLAGVLASIDCRIHSIDEKGDHFIVFGEVQSLGVHRSVAPLVFFQGGFGGFTPGSFMVPTDHELVESVNTAQAVRAEMDSLAHETGAEVTALARIGDDVVAVASVAGPGLTTRTVLGSRYPLMAPVGELFVAWEGDDVVQWWLGRTRGLDEAQRAELMSRLELARAQGWVYSLADASGGDGELAGALRDYGTDAVTPARQRAVEHAIRAALSRYRVADLPDDRAQRVVSMLAPLRDRAGRVRLTLKLSQLGDGAAGLTREEAAARAQRLLAVAETAAAKIAAFEDGTSFDSTAVQGGTVSEGSLA
ncbi:flavin reductase [Nocardia higoensis]|uniref:flavin reductase n=1 Tax=Nocardia higoensis TaxID=228599 RepID=UPI0002D8B72A|nr:flavin reductase [Nocardia higoensis]